MVNVYDAVFHATRETHKEVSLHIIESYGKDVYTNEVFPYIHTHKWHIISAPSTPAVKEYINLLVEVHARKKGDTAELPGNWDSLGHVVECSVCGNKVTYVWEDVCLSCMLRPLTD